MIKQMVNKVELRMDLFCVSAVFREKYADYVMAGIKNRIISGGIRFTQISTEPRYCSPFSITVLAMRGSKTVPITRFPVRYNGCVDTNVVQKQ